MKVLFRGHTEFTEVPDQPATPTLPTGAPIARGSEAPADVQATSGHGVARAEAIVSAPTLMISDVASAGSSTMSFPQAGRTGPTSGGGKRRHR